MAETEIKKEQLSGYLQENILTLLCFDDDSAPLIINTIEVGSFESDIFKEVAKQAVEYHRQFNEAPKEHLPDLLEPKIEGNENEREAELYRKVLVNLYEFREDINKDYVLSQLTKFVRQQNLKVLAIDLVRELKHGNIDEADQLIDKNRSTGIEIFEPGIFFADPRQSLGFFEEIIPPYSMGIEPLTRMGIGPAPGELLVILAAANRGKSWFLGQLGKAGVMQRLKVLHISLEMSEQKMSQRYIQSFFAYSKREAKHKYINFRKDETGRFMDMQVEHIHRPTLQQKGVQKELERRINKFKGRIQLYIKRFPTGALNIAGLESYLDTLERFHHWTPDIILLDYADLMKIDSKNLRTDTGFVYKELRRIAVERNVAMVTASQSNRLAEDAKVITLKHLAEDYSKAATADNIIAYCQTSAELKLGLARLFVAKARDEEREQSVLISQAYGIGQFHMDSIAMNSNRYWEQVDAMVGGEDNADRNPTDPLEGALEEAPKRRKLPRRRRP